MGSEHQSLHRGQTAFFCIENGDERMQMRTVVRLIMIVCRSVRRVYL